MIHFLLHFAGHWSAPVIALLAIAALCFFFPVAALANRGVVIIAVIAIGLYSGGLILGRKAQREADAGDMAKSATELAKAQSEAAAATVAKDAVVKASKDAALAQAAQIEALSRMNAARDARTAKAIADIYAARIGPTCPDAIDAFRAYLSKPVPVVTE